MISYSQNGSIINVHVKPEHVKNTVLVLKAHTQTHMDTFVDLVGIDCRATQPTSLQKSLGVSGYKLVYTLLSVKHNARLNIHSQVPGGLNQPTLSTVYPSAGWYEREVWDLLGVYFVGNQDMRRILSDYQFVGHALRKDYPLVGYVEAFFYDADARVVYLPVRLAQEAKQFRVLKT